MHIEAERPRQLPQHRAVLWSWSEKDTSSKVILLFFNLRFFKIHSCIQLNAFFVRFSCDINVYGILKIYKFNVVFHTQPHTPQTLKNIVLNKGYLVTHKQLPLETSAISKETIYRVRMVKKY